MGFLSNMFKQLKKGKKINKNIEELENTFDCFSKNGIKFSYHKEGNGFSYFGGKPLVPRDFKWPYFKTNTFEDLNEIERPLTFLAQFDCEELSNYDVDGLLPKHGILSFFYCIESERWGFDKNDKGSFRVYWFESIDGLKEAIIPDDLSLNFSNIKLFMSFENKKTYLPYDYLPEEYNDDDYINLIDRKFFDHDNNSWLLGHSFNIQNTMEDECELVSRCYYLGGEMDNIPEKTREEAYKHAKDEWQLLLQFDSIYFEDFELMFGDAGRLYFWIKKEDLKACNFDKVWMILQCY